jgi:hypothetical protein
MRVYNDVADRTKQVPSNKLSLSTSFLAARNCPFEPIVSEFESERTWCMMRIAVASSSIACFRCVRCTLNPASERFSQSREQIVQSSGQGLLFEGGPVWGWMLVFQISGVSSLRKIILTRGIIEFLSLLAGLCSWQQGCL